jgi:hypothetical protein
MKIIGKTPSGRILEATTEELGQLLGYHDRHNVSEYSIEVGHEIEVHKMFSQLYGLARAQDELKRVSTTLHSIANLLLIADPVIETVVKGAKE